MDKLQNLIREECPLPLIKNWVITMDVQVWITEFEDYIKLEKLINSDTKIDEIKLLIVIIGKEARSKLQDKSKRCLPQRLAKDFVMEVYSKLNDELVFKYECFLTILHTIKISKTQF
ncbi:hypothetical protein A3Q56_07751 [Intoshia linei]|uniref:Uncharacterized protein n=1 Tax=Intoshia linei TaxID=1819745 RepID=A0A177AT27_9BILA|nr:hypothetical protein A3Q56_07751 [Intoshia linei]